MGRLKEVLVVGAGVAGAATALSLQRRGVQVTLIDAWQPGHARAASGGEHRILRSSHGTDELYTRWSRDARMAWLQLQEERGLTLFVQSGAVMLAHERDSSWEDRSRQTLGRLGIPHFTVPAAELPVRFPIIDPQGITYGLVEPESGFVYAKTALLALIDQFTDEGGVVERGRVTTDDRERPVLDGSRMEADRIVMACGAWMSGLFPRTLRRMIEVVRQDVILVATPPGDVRYDHTHCPAWVDHHYPAYGIPASEGHGFKAAIAWRKLTMDVDADDRVVDPTSMMRSRLYLSHRFPGLTDQPVVASTVCQIANTIDTHFLIDWHPDHEDILLVAGDSGHLFKHGPVVGDFTADVATGAISTDERFRYRDRSAVALTDRPQ